MSIRSVFLCNAIGTGHNRRLQGEGAYWQQHTRSVFITGNCVGKTTYMYHLAHILEKRGKSVLLVDLDSQCNLSAYSISDTELEKSWKNDRGNSIWNALEPVYERLGDIRKRKPSKIKSDYPNLNIVPGDVLLSNSDKPE